MASTNRVGQPVWIAPSAAARIGGETLPPLILNAIGTRYYIDARLDGSIQDGSIESTTKGAPSLTLSVLDPDGEMLNSGLFNRRIDLDMDNVPFRLVQVSRQEDDLLSLEFEHRLCSWLREHDTPRKASRGTKTRAEFAYSLVLEVKKEPIHFVSPDLDKRQPRAAKVDQPTRDARKAPGFIHGKAIKGRGSANFTPAQLRNADRVLSVAAGKKASEKATKALVEACIVEGPDFDNPMGGDASSVGILQLLSGWLGGSTSTKGGRRDIELVSTMFLERGFYGRGGAMALARAHPTWSAGMVAQQVQGSAYPARYDQVADVAQRVIDAWRGEALSSDSGTRFAKFEFTRGAIHKGDAKEDSWMALQRLADQVRWRCFIDGRNVIYFVSDDQLMRSRPLYLVDRDTHGVRSVTFDMEVGRRTVIYKGRRQRKPSEAILKVRMGRWAAPPGSVIELADYGLADGRWLVDSMGRGIFDAEAEVHLRQPQKALPEPAPSRTSGGDSGGSRGSGGGSSSGGGSAAGTYVFPIGSGLTWGRIDMGVDFAGSGAIKAAGKAKVTRVSPQGSNTGWPGAGGGRTGAMIVIQLLQGSQKGKHIYLAENIDPVGGLRAGDVLEAGQVYAHARGQYPYLEIGWSDYIGQPLAHSYYTEGMQTREGKAFARWLHYLQSR